MTALRTVTVFCDQRLIKTDPILGSRKISADDAAEDQCADQKNRKIICGHWKVLQIGKLENIFILKSLEEKVKDKGGREYEEGLEDRSSGIDYIIAVFDFF